MAWAVVAALGAVILNNAMRLVLQTLAKTPGPHDMVDGLGATLFAPNLLNDIVVALSVFVATIAALTIWRRGLSMPSSPTPARSPDKAQPQDLATLDFMEAALYAGYKTPQDDAGQLTPDVQTALYAKVTTDSLTGLANRPHLLARLNEAVSQSVREPDRAISLILFTLPHFVSADKSGPGTSSLSAACAALSDRDLSLHRDLLRSVLEHCQHAIRPSDLLARLQGTQFAVLLSNANPRAAMNCAERLRHTLLRLPFDGAPKPLTEASFGVATRKHGETPADLLDRASDVLHQPHGRGNAIIFASNAPPLPASRQHRPAL